MEINQLKKSIKDKFNVIKGQIAVYKKKNGDNMELYNKFVDRINETLKDTEVNMGDKKEENKININNNKSGSELNLNLNKSNNSSGNDSGSGSGCGDRGSTRNNLVSDSGLNNLEELAEYNYENKHMENSDINKKQFCEERDEGFNTNIDIITNQTKPHCILSQFLLYAFPKQIARKITVFFENIHKELFGK